MAPISTSVNEMGFNQAAALLTSAVKQATGQNVITPTNTSEFVSVAQSALLTGYDPMLQAISQMVSRTIFSVRPYYAKFRGLMADSVRYGNHVRKLQALDTEIKNSQMYPECGTSVDQQVVCCPNIVQTNFYGQSAYDKCVTLFRNQLNVAFSGPDEFARFVSMVLQNISDQMEQTNEEAARLALANFIAGKIAGDAKNVIHLLTEYNTEHGTEYTAEQVRAPEIFPSFARWVLGRIRYVSDMLTERSIIYHTNLTGKDIPRHTPLERQKVYLYSKFLNEVNYNALSETFNDRFAQVVDHEFVNYWQSITSPDEIQITPTYLLPDGSLTSPTNPVIQDKVIGVIFDEEAVGFTRIDEWSAPAPFNAAAGYTTMWWHWVLRYWNDFTENGVVFLLD